MAYTRRQELTCTEDQMRAKPNVILRENEVIYIKMNDGTLRQKIGDGVNAIINLPFTQVFDGNVVQTTGNSKTAVMSQEATTRELNLLSEKIDDDLNLLSEKIADDLNLLSDEIDDKADAIINTKIGDTVIITDASEKPFKGLRLFGKSKQEDTPTPGAPVDIVSVGEGGEISVSVDGDGTDTQICTVATPNGLNGIPVLQSKVSNYTDVNGQKWLCDEVDFERGVYVKRINKITFDGTETWTRSVQTTMFQAFMNVPKGINLIQGDYAGYSTHYSLKSYMFGTKPYLRIGASNQLYVEYALNEMESIDAWKTYLAEQKAAGTPVSVMYGLATPIETPLTDSELSMYKALITVKSGMTITNNANAYMQVEYAADTKTYVQKENTVLDYEKYGLPILRLMGNTDGISKDDAVTLRYIFNKKDGSCTLKWQGSSSLSYPKKNYTIKFDKAFEAVDGWGEQKKYCLKANYIDFSHARNVVCAKLWGQIVKSRAVANERLNALPNGGAVDGFPIIVEINGEYQGLYTFNIPKDAWMYGMGASENEAIVGADNHCLATFFNETATFDGDFEIEYAPDEDNVDWIKTSINQLITACRNSNSTTYDENLDKYIDWDSVIDYCIFVALVGGIDMTGKNYLLYTYDGIKWGFGAYDMDSTFGLYWNGTYFIPTTTSATNGTVITAYAQAQRAVMLARAHKKDEIKARYSELRAGIMSEDNVITTFANFIGSIPKAVYDAEVKLWSTLPSTSDNNLSQIQDWYRRRVLVSDANVQYL